MLVFIGPVSLVVGHRQELGLRLLLHWLARERMGTDPLVGQPVCCGLYRESFSEEQWDPAKSIGVSRSVAMCGQREICMVLDHTWTEREKRVACWSSFPLHSVHRFESLQLLNMSNRLFVAIIT
jgi:hypothetical protein